MRELSLVKAIAASAVLLGASVANAAIVTWEINATVTSGGSYDNPMYVPSGKWALGNTIQVVLTFDDATPLKPAGSFTVATFKGAAKSLTFDGETVMLTKSLEIGDIDYGDLTAAGMQLSNSDFYHNNAKASMFWFTNTCGAQQTTVNAQLLDIQSSVGANCVSVKFGTMSWYSVAKVTSFVPQVPVPAAAYLFGSALFGLAASRKYRR